MTKSVVIFGATTLAVPVLVPIVTVAAVGLAIGTVGYVFCTATVGAIGAIVDSGKQSRT